MSKNILTQFLDKLFAFPLWVKQIIYLRLYQNLASYLSEDFITTREEDIFHLYVPNLTFLGRTELAERSLGLDENVYTFLSNVAHDLSIVEISMNNFWTMEEVAKFFILALDQQFIKAPNSSHVTAMAGFMSGKYRTGEYFRRVDKINVNQLEQTILKQKELEAKGTPGKMAEIMISLGYITEKDTSSLLMLKEEAKKRFILDPNIIPKDYPTTTPKDFKSYQDEVVRLTEQNKILKEKLARILAFVKK